MTKDVGDATKDIGRDVGEALYDDALLEQVLRESANDIPPIRPKGYGITMQEFATAKGCSHQTAGKWLKAHGYKAKVMRMPVEGSRSRGLVQVFTRG